MVPVEMDLGGEKSGAGWERGGRCGTVLVFVAILENQ